MKSVNERRELKHWGGELISFAPTPSMNFGLSDEHIRQAHITARVETSDAGSRITGTRVVTMGVFALAAKKKKKDVVKLLVVGDDISREIVCDGAGARAKAEAFAHKVNGLSKVAVNITNSDAPSKLDQLSKLGQLRDQGVLNDEEFQTEKARLLS
jgi:hypothetical protein